MNKQDATEPRYCPECAKRGFHETPSMKDNDLCGDCHDILGVEIIERQSFASLQDWE